MLIKLFVTLFVLFAVSRAYLRYREAALGFGGLMFWSLIWIAVEAVVWWPGFTDTIAKKIGVSRGVDALVYLSITLLFYGIFRLYIKTEFLEREITSLVRSMAIKEEALNNRANSEKNNYTQ